MFSKGKGAAFHGPGQSKFAKSIESICPSVGTIRRLSTVIFLYDPDETGVSIKREKKVR